MGPKLIIGTPAANAALRSWEEKRLDPPDEPEDDYEDDYDDDDGWDEPEEDYRDDDYLITEAENAYEAGLGGRYE